MELKPFLWFSSKFWVIRRLMSHTCFCHL